MNVKRVARYLKTWRHVIAMKKTCDELVKNTFPAGRYDKSKSIFDRIEDTYNDLLKKEKTYILYRNFTLVVSTGVDTIADMEGQRMSSDTTGSDLPA